METKILLGAFLFLLGWLWYYLFFRQFIYNFTTAYPLIRQMRKEDPELISPNATRYTTVSVIASLVICAVIAAIVCYLCRNHVYYIISFFCGALISFLFTFKKLSPQNRAMFESFCSAYYRFIPDDELRTAMYNKKIDHMKSRLHAMNKSSEFIPSFKD